MRVLVTGATGHLGRAVVARLSLEGHAVSVITRRPFLAADVLGPDIEAHEWHPLSEAFPADAVEGADAILNLMGAPLSGGPPKATIADIVATRLNSKRRQVEDMNGPPLRLDVASIAIAPAEGGAPVTEDTPSTAKPSSLERFIRSWEDEAAAAAGSGASVAVARLGLVAMPGGPLSALMALARRGLCPSLKGAVIPAIALDDAVAMLTGLLQHRALEGIIHGVAPEPLEGEVLMHALRRHAPGGRALTVPVSLLRRRLGLAAALLSCHRQIVPQRLAAAGTAYVSPDPTGAVEQALHEIRDSRRGAQRDNRSDREPTPPTAEPEVT